MIYVCPAPRRQAWRCYPGAVNDDEFESDGGELDLDPVEVPPESLSAAAIEGVIAAFVLREGTDYGVQETSHERKLEQVRQQLDRREIVIVYDPKAQWVTLMPRAAWKKQASASPG
jgi:hypothetical protein